MKNFYLLILSYFLMNPFFDTLSCTRGLITIDSVTPSQIDFSTSLNQTVSMNITHAGTGGCRYLLVLDYGAAVGAPIWENRVMTEALSGSTLPFNAYKNATLTNNRIIRDINDYSSNQNVIRNPNFNAPGTQTKTFVADMPTPPATASPGLYIEALSLKLIVRAGGAIPGWPVVDTRALSFTYEVPYILDIAIVDTSAVFNIGETAYMMNFGKLETAATRTADIVIQTNVGYVLRVSSLNDGELRHSVTTDTIDYTLDIGAMTNINLVGSFTTPVIVSSQAGFSPSGGFRLPITATVGTVSGGELAGSYQDKLELTIEAF